MSFANCDQAPSLIHTSLHSNPPTDKHIFIWRTRTTLPFSEPTAGLSADSLTSESGFYICGLSSQVVDYHHKLWTINTICGLSTQSVDYQHNLRTINTICGLSTQVWTIITICGLSAQIVDYLWTLHFHISTLINVSTCQHISEPTDWLPIEVVQLSTLALFVWVSGSIADRTIRRAIDTIDLIDVIDNTIIVDLMTIL